jgi:SSS family transporter
MTAWDWLVLWLSQLLIVGYGVFKTRHTHTTLQFMKAGKSQGWLAVGLSVMATQASAITFLSGPGQAFAEGMGFLQFYFGLPLAMLVIIGFFLPAYERLNITTAYEFLEKRFGLGVRLLTAGLFLIQRGLAAGFTIFAPSLVFSVLLGWDIRITNLLCGSAVVLYTVTGGSRAVAETQKLQMAVMMAGLFFGLFLLVRLVMPEISSSADLWSISKATGRLEVINMSVNTQEKYTLWSGLIGGFFVALSYFGTDQSQVARYVGGRNREEARKGLLMNAFLKIPMQAMVLYCGVLLYVYYLLHPRPLNFNPRMEEAILQSDVKAVKADIKRYQSQRDSLARLLKAENFAPQAVAKVSRISDSLQKVFNTALTNYWPVEDLKDTNYSFLRFAMEHFPAGALGLIISMLFSAAMSSASSELNALATVTCVDFYQRLRKSPVGERDQLLFGRWATLLWGTYAIAFSMIAGRMGTLIEAVNILGSLVYGTILGIFLTGLFLPQVRGREVLWAGCLAEATVLILFFTDALSFLWFNVVGALLVVGLSLFFSKSVKIFRPKTD